MHDVYIYGENSVTLLGLDSRTTLNTYLIQLWMKPSEEPKEEKKIRYEEDEDYQHYDDSENEDIERPKPNMLLSRAEKISIESSIKVVRKYRSVGFCASSSRKVAAVVFINFFKNYSLILIFYFRILL